MSAVHFADELWLLLAALGLNLSVGFAGQPMLGQGAAVAAGAYGVILLADPAHLPHLPLGIAAACAVAGCGLVGWLVDLGAARLRGAYLALATWALAWLAFSAITSFPSVFGGSQGLSRDTPARLVSPALGVSWRVTVGWHLVIATALCALVLAATQWLHRGPVGLDLAALRADPAAASSLGIRVATLRRNTLAASTALGALAGVGRVTLHGLVAPGDVSPLLSVQLFVAVLLGGGAVVLGPVLGVAVLAAIPSVADRFASAVGMPVERARGVLTAALLILALAVRDPVAGLVSRLLPARSRRRPGLPPARAATPFRVAAAGAPLLEARALVRSFGAVRALDGLDLDVRAGEVHALIGPNGSGKTTALRVLSGAVSPDRGTVRVNGADVTRGGEADRVRAGVVRTFQRTVLLPGVAVGAQVAAGARAGEAAGRALPALLGVPSARRRHQESLGAVAALLADTRLLARADDPPTNLAHGEQRLLQIARAVATGARVLLLDEPAAGMTPDEVAVLRDELRRLVGNGAGVLLVEHDVRFVSAVADRVTVLAEGRVLAVGTPAQVRRDPAVQLAYLGRQHLREGDDT